MLQGPIYYLPVLSKQKEYFSIFPHKPRFLKIGEQVSRQSFGKTHQVGSNLSLEN